ncbi:MAG: carboxypeptidase regulatory-like domain-containing protein [Acidobacteriaceae bacterium]|nr:carboxypeptidase regulatory-like domain-containing protein [Acidobacteriaceae bacterium]
MFAQTTISTGSIQGIVTDPSGAVVPNGKVTITNKATGQVFTTTTSSAGTYSSGALAPGNYAVRVEAQSFKTITEEVPIQVGVTTPGNFKLQLGETGQVIEVQADTTQVNTEQATVQGVLSPEQIENLPINGRNFLDLAQLEPGVQIQDGGTFDPTKKGFSSISFGGRFGRTARIEVDGVDVSDETVGTTTQDIPQSAIQEFQLGESMLDLSTELTSSGSVNVVTKSGTNNFHGQGYYMFRDQSLDANLPNALHTPFQRNQFGGNFGGAIIKDKLFFFVDAERTKQDFQQPVVAGPPLQADSGSFSAPFREAEGIARLDYQITKNYKMFYRFSYDQNSDVTPFEPVAFQPMDNTTHTRDHVVGLDFTSGRYTHSIRFGYMKFFNKIKTGVAGSTPFNTSSAIELSIGPDAPCLNSSGVVPDVFCSGQPFLAPQATPQSDHQIKYDGSRTFGAHILRYGGGFNHIHGGGFAGFLADGPAVNALASACTGICLTLPGGAANALNYPVQNVLIGNGQGFSTSQAAFGFPGGGLGPDNRVSWYVGDSWKIKPNLTVTYGLRYVRDTGRSDSDLAPIAALNQFNNQFYSGLGNRVNNPDTNFAPQIGLAWDPWNNGRTVIRGGVGLFYENSIFNNVLFDRPGRLTNGTFLAIVPACLNGGAVPVSVPNGPTITPSFCGQPIGQVQAQVASLQAQYQAAAQAVGSGPNPTFIGSTLADGTNITSTNLFDPNYKTPRSVQMNFGIQREIHRGTVFTADYLRNVSTHTLLAVDTNLVGDTRFFNLANARKAIAATLAACGQSTIGLAISQGTCTTAGNPAPHTATITDFAVNGLDDGYSLCGGFACPHAAFPGVNPNVGSNQMLFPAGRSVYNGLQTSLRQDIRNPFKGIPYINLQVSYALSRYVAQAQDSDFINNAFDNANPSKYTGPNGLDRTHQISFGGTMQLPGNFAASVIGHFYSGLPVTLTLGTTGLAGGIFQTAVNGDGEGDGALASGSQGSLGGVLPGTNLGSFGRGVNSGNLNTVIDRYNTNYAGQPTPAGQVLISQGLFTLGQLQRLGGVMPALSPAPANEAFDGWLRDMDFSLNWTYKIKERVQLQPGVSFFNIMNFVNFDPPKNTLGGVLSPAGTPAVLGTANGTPGEQPNSLRIGLGSGVFGLGSPRVLEFALKLNF